MKLQPVTSSQPLFGDRTAYVGSAQDFEALQEFTSWPTGNFVLMLLADFREWPGGAFVDWAAQVIGAGAVYVCCWGPGCRRAEDCFDEADVYLEETAGRELPVIMTTSHSDEPIEEALWFAANSTWPDEAYAANCHSLVAVAVSDRAWEEQTHAFLTAEPVK